MAATEPKYTEKPPEVYDVGADAGLVQNGTYNKPTFMGDMTASQAFAVFNTGVQTALSYAGQTSRKNEIVQTRNESTGYRLTQSEFTLLQKRAASISNYAKIPYDTCEDFLLIICFVDKHPDMIKIADAIQIDELANPAIMRKPMEILNIPGLERIAFAAQALDGLVNMYRKYIQATQSTNNQSSDGNDIGAVMQAISGFIGGMESAGVRLETGELGSFMSELITGARIPINIIAKNPILQAPSYAGKVFFGELPGILSNIDIDQIFNKPIAAFAKMAAGAGTSAFVMQNFSSFSQAMPVVEFAAKILTGSADVSSLRKLGQVMQVVDQVVGLTGGRATDIIDITRADNAIPMMMAMASTMAGFDKNVFSGSTFQEGWIAAQAVAQQLSRNDPGFIEAARRFL
jgi:hypothetical protein